MISQTLTIARTTFLESVRQPIYFILLVLSGIAMVLVTWSTGFTMEYRSTGEVSGDNKSLLEIGLATVFVAGTLLAGFIATSAMSREIERRTVLTVVSKPVPRPVLVLGKFVGVAASMLIATIIMLVFLQLALRHGVQSTAADDVDKPVVVFGLSAAFIALAVAVWGNFFYGWSFTQTASLLLCPLIVLAWVLVLLINKNWQVQPLSRDFKPQILIASVSVGAALLVLTAVAIAASARLGQVMTIVICLVVMLFGLLSGPVLGRYAFSNTPLAAVLRAVPEKDRFEPFSSLGDVYLITLKTGPSRSLRPGDSLYYGPYPNGFDLQSGSFEPRTAPDGPFNPDDLIRAGSEPGLVVTDVKDLTLTVRNIGERGVSVSRPPREGDYVFKTPTQTNALALAAWGIVPNFQAFWMVDAVSQNQPVPFGHLALVLGYAAMQIGLFLALAVLLFQNRDVG